MYNIVIRYLHNLQNDHPKYSLQNILDEAVKINFI